MKSSHAKSLFPFIIAIFFFVSACSKKDTRAVDDETHEYYPDGTLYKETKMYADQTGFYKEYFKNGQLFQEVTFLRKKREGVAKKYYEHGGILEETPYFKGKKHGVVKRYRRTGELMAEIPYFESNLCKDLKEYTIDQKLKTRYPKIVFKEVDNLMTSGNFTLEIKLSDDTKGNVEYYEGVLTKEGYIGHDAAQLFDVKQGVAYMRMNLQPGMYIMKELNIIAKVKTAQSNYKILEGKYNLAIDRKF
ncbi:toxin-antitoxin system YwqK family antitoxin [Pseudochryseolinea flava]|uniref:Toxin-antitoxin system YwqK family antitoxin n=1 Tax=Pseudochryseolinea flava TaxID=2059302 RepID=A0A364Y8E5_9BACT|nr:hypothetical protein [Pseudochryseolinea flava]RAW03384.1 hypothetical protein DQQ10_04675 [Pseudochryseolinea flava]